MVCVHKKGEPIRLIQKDMMSTHIIDVSTLPEI
jgi:hypothetical protein